MIFQSHKLHLCVKHFQRSFHKLHNFVVEPLTCRSLIKITGNDKESLLQGLITNDVNHINTNKSSMYCMFLNTKGRVLFDAILYNYNEDFLVECDSNLEKSLITHLNIYKVRRKVNILNIDSELKTWVMYPRNETVELPTSAEEISTELPNLPSESVVSPDPRLKELGIRILLPSNINFTNSLPQRDSGYNFLRYKLGVAEGSKEIIPEKCIPLEANCDYLNGVDFNKGCYIGQELTARAHHTGVVRKRFMPLFSDAEVKLTNGAKITDENNKVIGSILGWDCKNGVGLLRISNSLRATKLKVEDTILTTMRPHWWPTEENKNL